MSHSKQAAHHEECAHYLQTDQKFGDWVSTTCFYSALHLVYSRLFPLEKAGVVYSDFRAWYAATIVRPKKKLSQHTATKMLVATELPALRSAYNKLFDLSMEARYGLNYFDFEELRTKEALKALEAVKTACTKP